MSSHHHATRRTAVAVALISATAAALSGCNLLPTATPSSKAVDFDDVQSATVYLKGQGTFIEPGTTSSSARARSPASSAATPTTRST
jgi:hypothetical protein